MERPDEDPSLHHPRPQPGARRDRPRGAVRRDDGAFEVWINGEKTFSQRGNFRSRGPSLRWSNGIYCTRWDTETPTGPRELTFWHDNMRITTTYAEAEPASWGEGEPRPADAGADSTAGRDASNPSNADGARGTGGSGGMPGSTGGADGSTGPSQGGTSGNTTAPSGTGRADGGPSTGPETGPSPPPTTPPPRAGGVGCRFGGTSGGAVNDCWLALLVGLLLIRRKLYPGRSERP